MTDKEASGHGMASDVVGVLLGVVQAQSTAVDSALKSKGKFFEEGILKHLKSVWGAGVTKRRPERFTSR